MLVPPDLVQLELFEPELDEVVEPGRVLARVRRDEERFPHVLRFDVARGSVEIRGNTAGRGAPGDPVSLGERSSQFTSPPSTL